MTHPVPPAPGYLPGPAGPFGPTGATVKRPTSLTASIAASAVLGGITLVYLLVVLVMVWIDGVKPDYRLNALGWTLTWMGIIGILLSLFLIVTAGLSGLSAVARGIAAATAVILEIGLIALVIAYLAMADKFHASHALYFVAWFVPALLAIFGVAVIVSYGFGWGYFREKSAQPRFRSA